MSGTSNEFDDPGANYPDNSEADGVQPGPAEQRSDAGVGGEVHHESGDASNVQDEPLLDQNSTTTQEQIQGIVAQTRADLGGESDDRYAEVLRQRLEDAGIQMTDEDRQRLAGKANPTSGGGGV